jgi:hypothetical protein
VVITASRPPADLRALGKVELRRDVDLDALPPREPQPTLIVYVDTSVVLRVLFAQPDPLEEWSRWQEAYTSELMGVARRAVDRLRVEQALEDEGVARALEGPSP